MRHRLHLIGLALVLGGATVAPALAQSARQADGNGQLMQQMQQLAADRTRLTTENAKLKAELEAAHKERDELKSKQGGADTRLRNSEAAAVRAERSRDTLQADLDREKARMTELVGKFRETATTLREVETDRTAARASLAKAEAGIKQCTARNQALYDLNGEILTQLELHGRRSAPLETFTRLKRIELENLIDGYQTRAQEQAPPPAPTADTSAAR